MIIREPICIMKVRNAIQYPSQDLGTLCSAGEPYINKWSKYKPVIHNCFGSGVQYYPDNWWKSSHGNCGISYIVYNSINELYNACKEADNSTSNLDIYTYEIPIGGANSPYRLGDFAGYDSDATPPIMMGMSPGTITINDSNPELSKMRFSAFKKDRTQDELTAEDIFSDNFLSNGLFRACFGVAYRDKINGGSWTWATKLIEGNETVIERTGRNGLSNDRTYEFVSFITDFNSRGEFSSQGSPNKLVPLPKRQALFSYVQTFNVEKSSESSEEEELRNRSIRVTGYFSKNNFSGEIDYSRATVVVTVGCEESTWVITDLRVMVEFGYSEDSSYVYFINSSNSSEAITIRPNSYREFNKPLFNRKDRNQNFYKNIKLTVYVNGTRGGYGSVLVQDI